MKGSSQTSSSMLKGLGVKDEEVVSSEMSRLAVAPGQLVGAAATQRLPSTGALSELATKTSTYASSAPSWDRVPRADPSEMAMNKIVEAFKASASSLSGPEQRQRLLESISSKGFSERPNIESGSSITEDDWRVKKLLDGIDDWKTVDVFKLAEATKGRPLAAVVKTVLVKLRLIKYFDMCKLDIFLRDLELKYPGNPYHNSTHAADVVHAIYKIMTMDDLMIGKFEDWEMLGMVLGAAGHDVGHPGVNNKCLVDTRDPLALKHNCDSPNEREHSAIMLELLQDHKLLPDPEAALVQSLIPDILLKTDMLYHKTLISEFTGYVTLYGNDLGNWKDVKARTCAMCMILHMADISNVVRDFSLARQWATRIIQENHEQGDRLRALNMEVASLYDRNKPDGPGQQIAFINVFGLRDAFAALGAVAPSFGKMASFELYMNEGCYNQGVIHMCSTIG